MIVYLKGPHACRLHKPPLMPPPQGDQPIPLHSSPDPALTTRPTPAGPPLIPSLPLTLPLSLLPPPSPYPWLTPHLQAQLQLAKASKEAKDQSEGTKKVLGSAFAFRKKVRTVHTCGCGAGKCL